MSHRPASRSERVYGLHAVRALLARQPQRVQRVLLARGRADQRATAIEVQARAAQVGVERVHVDALKGLVGDVVHQGVVAEIEPLPPWREEDLLAAVATARDPLVLALDGAGPAQPGACWYRGCLRRLVLVVPRDRSAPLNATARKVTAGAAETTPVVTVTNLVRTLKLLKDAGLWIVGADAEAEQPAAGIDLVGPRVLVMGAEGAGLRELTRRNCDWLVRLPSVGAVESLNVSVATGMLLYEALRQRAAAPSR
jgi:23S rRNA (guanosine2251-2'-O)-methyltransferase